MHNARLTRKAAVAGSINNFIAKYNNKINLLAWKMIDACYIQRANLSQDLARATAQLLHTWYKHRARKSTPRYRDNEKEKKKVKV